LSLVRAVSEAQPGESGAGFGRWSAISFRVLRYFKGLRRHLLLGVRAQPPRGRRLAPSIGPLEAGALQFWQGANVFNGLSPKTCHFVTFSDTRRLVPQRGMRARSEPHRCAGAARDKRKRRPLFLVRTVSEAQPGEWDAGIG
jgi:hypothetical protein